MALTLTANVDCEECGETYAGAWRSPVEDPQDMAEAPEAPQTCPACGHTQAEEYPGWQFYGEAG